MKSLQEKKEAIENVLGVYSPGQERSAPALSSARDSKPELNNLEMARVVIRNAGRPLKPERISDMIKDTYGRLPAKTLYDMLLRCVRNGTHGFIKNADGEIGLVEMEATLATVSSIHANGESLAATAIA